MTKKLYKYKKFWLLLLSVVYLLFGFLFAPKLIEKQLKIQFKQQLDMQAQLSAVIFNPFNFSIKLSALSLTDRNQKNWYNSPQTSINFDPLNLLWGEWKFSDLYLTQPNITLLTDESGQVIIPALPEFLASEKTDAGIDLLINHIQLVQGQINLQADNIEKDFALNIKNLNFSLNELSLTDEANQFKLSFSTDHNESIELEGHYNHAQQILQSKIKLSDWLANTFNQVLPDQLLLKNHNGLLHAEGHIDWPLQQKPVLSFNHIQIDNWGVLWHNAIELLGLTATLNGVVINTETQQVNIENFHSEQASWQVTWPFEIPEKILNDELTESQNITIDGSPTDENVWQITVKKTSIKQWPIELIDKSIAANLPIKINSLVITSLNNNNTPFQLTGQIAVTQLGNITVNSKQSLSPFSLDGNMTLQAIHLPDLAPWIADQTGLVITQGSLNGQQNIITDSTHFVANGHLAVIDTLIQNHSAVEVAYLGQLIIGSTQIVSADKTITLDQINLDHANGNIFVDNDSNFKLQSLSDDKTVEATGETPSEWLIKLGDIHTKIQHKTLDD